MREIDHMEFGGNCPGPYYIPVDSATSYVMISVYTSGVPYPTLSDAYGNAVNASYRADGTVTFMGLAPGGYQLTVDNGGVPSISCVITVLGSSSLSVVDEFVTSPNSDKGPYTEAAIVDTSMYIIAHGFNVTAPGQLKAVTIRNKANYSVVYRSALANRYHCGYEYYAGGFSCPSQVNYVLQVDGVDNNGYPFRRSFTFPCMPKPIPPTTTTLTPPVLNCQNGGTPFPSAKNVQYCSCPELFTGTQCEIPNCMNHGTLKSDGLTCECEIGYTGDNCEHLTCEPNLGAFLTDYKTLVVVVRDTPSMNPYFPAIYSAINNAFLDPSTVYFNYLLVRFANGVYLPHIHEDFDSFMHDLNTLNKTMDDDDYCTDQTFDALYSVFETYVFEKSPILFFSNAVPSDADKWRMVTESNTRRQLPIYSFFIPKNTSSCPFDPLNEGYRALLNAVLFSGGMAFNPNSADNLARLLQYVIRGTTTNMNLVYADDLYRCTSPGYRSFMIDSSTDDVVIMATGKGMLFRLWNPSNTSDNTFTIYNGDGFDYMWEVKSGPDGSLLGEYYMTYQTVNPSDSCSIRVMARSQYDLFFATTSADYIDAIDTQPVVGTPLAFVAQFNGLVNATNDPFRLFAELAVRTNMNNENQIGKPMYYSNGKYRDGCGYHMYFGVSNFCEYPDQMFYATVFADDNNGFAIQRTSIGYCSLSYITVAPPGTCQNGGALDPSNNVTCLCPAGYTGDYCQQVICQNGGTPAGFFCICVGGTSGTFCEQYECPLPNTAPINSPLGQSMVFVVSATTAMTDAWNKLAAGIADFVRDIEARSPNWIITWSLIVPSGQDVEIVLSNSDSPNAFIAAVKSVQANLTSYINGQDCLVQLYEAINYGVYYSNKRSSVYVFTVSDGVMDDTSYTTAYLNAINNQITINIIGAGDSVCLGGNNQGPFGKDSMDLAYGTSGFVYMTSAVDKMLPYITGMYMSGISGQGGADDCTEGITSYFAVDGWTQAMTLAVTGGNVTSVEVTLPDGSRSDNYELELVNAPYLTLRQYIRECPSGGWIIKSQSCFFFGHIPTTWISAAGQCHDVGASLVNIYSQATDDVVKFNTQGVECWIGLIRHNDGWIWDVYGSTTTKYLDPTYAPWAPGQPVNDSSLNCVLINKDGLWENRNCAENHAYSCQMHSYGQGFAPTDPNQGLLPGGRWAVKVTTATGGCFAELRSQSEIQVYFGFSQDPTNDFPVGYANADASQNYILANPVGVDPWVSDTNPSMEGRLNYAAIMAGSTSSNNSNSVYMPLVMNNRWGCGYPYISQAFQCPKNSILSSFGVWFSGIDQFGYAFERYSDAQCQRSVAMCNNGFKDPTSGKCVCSAGYTGTLCNVPICINGELDPNTGACKCSGNVWGGTFCDIPYCEPPHPRLFQEQGRTLAIALETSYLMGSTIMQMKRNLQKAIESVINDPSTAGWFSNYILYPFDSTSNRGSWYPPTVSNNYQDIVKAVQNISTLCPPSGICSTMCERPIMSVLKNILSMDAFNNPNSVILVVTRSAPEDFSGPITPLVQESKAQINFALTAVSSPCGMGWNTNAANQMYNVVSYSDGNIFVMSPVDLVNSFIPNYLPTLYKSGALESASLDNCSFQDVLFQVEHDMYEFTIDYYMPVTDPPFQIVLTDPAGDFISLPGSIISSDTNYLGVVKVNDTGATRAGTYRLRITGGNSNYCYLNIRGRSSVVLYPGFVLSNDGYNGATNDAAHFYPTYEGSGVLNTLVVHAEGLDNGGSLTYAQYVVPGYGLQHTTALYRRDSACGYEWYANLPYGCDHSTMLVVVYGKDYKGGIFHRNYVVSCVNNRPPTPPPPAVCARQNANQNFVFMLDSSITATADNFNTFKSFVENVMYGYNIAQNYTLVGVVSVADKGYQNILFNDYTDYSSLATKINAIPYVGTAGQNTSSAFEIIFNNYDNSAPGYNIYARHSIIYVTATNPTDADPSAWPTTIRRGGLYGIAVINFNNTASSALQAMVPTRCFYQSSDQTDLFVNGVNFVQQLTCAREAPCGMGGNAPSG